MRAKPAPAAQPLQRAPGAPSSERPRGAHALGSASCLSPGGSEETMKVVRVREIMTKSVQTMPAHTTIEEAARILTSHHISGAPVLDAGRLVGVVSKSDLVDPDNH